MDTTLFGIKKRLLQTAVMYCLLACLLWQHSACADDNYERAQDYILKYKPLAVDEMKRTGIPASIKLAQALLETNYGTSRLATEGKNHFGIKCKAYWQGDTLLVDDDTLQECFRRYPSVYDSYIDHSEFLRYHREGYYSHLFLYSSTDYISWAEGLQAAGYATSPNYAKNLIAIIQRYHLYDYDRPVTANYLPAVVPPPFNAASYAQNVPAPPVQSAKPDAGFSKTFVPKPAFNAAANPPLSSVAATQPAENPNQTGNATPHSTLQLEDVFINGLQAIIATADLHLSYIAARFNLPEDDVYEFNEARPTNKQVKAGIPIFLQPKKKKAASGIAAHLVQPNETLLEISQLYGMKVKSLCKLNKMQPDETPKPGSILHLH
ncbi:LysM peptidoglycan-binding domain-containing protein [Sphingobacteriales bacterium UPWRP_1]|nr:hypothetical protein BVG80_11105 [Sphingobacteriales bacterium TSM_CSM]PSJ74257.1 LysM peptidoglycan-binding domain-containing protein [Sphingobacteriales bacterium UPWRP_1]